MPPTNIRLFSIFLTLVFACSAVMAQEGTEAESLKDTSITVCQDEKDNQAYDSCRDGSLKKLAGKAEAQLQLALSKARPLTIPLLKRDAAWLAQMLGGRGTAGSEPWLTQRIENLEQIANGFGRAGIQGRWVNAFGTVTVVSQDNSGDIFEVRISTESDYGSRSGVEHSVCRARVQVHKLRGRSWLEGHVLLEGADPKSPPFMIRLVRQGETLRVVSQWPEDYGRGGPCNRADQMTGTYFPASAMPESGSKTPPSVLPSFDCLHPARASEEEICADPELAEADLRLNRAWKGLPHLDEATAKHLKADQRDYIKSQNWQFPEFLHPAWDKLGYNQHDTNFARGRLLQLQRERIAVLEGLEPHREGLEGLWFSYTASLRVTREADGTLKASGWKWEQGDWKFRCEYGMTGSEKRGMLTVEGNMPNPDTLERDHGTLVVNRRDDILAPQRDSNPEAGEAKCSRNQTVSSASRLFPVRPSPDINPGADGIR